MSDDNDLLAELPPPRDDEPSSLRQDIADELADHLACAFRRELVKSGDAETAQTRVLERFGDPIGLARQLWFQAMWSRIMSQRLVLACSVTMAVASLAAVGIVARMVQHQQMAAAEQQRATLAVLEQLSATLQRRSSEPAAPATPWTGDRVPFKVHVVAADDPNQGVEGALVTIQADGEPPNNAVSETTGKDGFADFGYADIGRYRMVISLPWGETTNTRFTVHPAQVRSGLEVIRAPSQPPAMSRIAIESGLADEFRRGGIAVQGTLSLKARNIGGLDWSASGLISGIGAQSTISGYDFVLTSDGRCLTKVRSPEGFISGPFGGSSKPSSWLSVSELDLSEGEYLLYSSRWTADPIPEDPAARDAMFDSGNWHLVASDAGERLESVTLRAGETKRLTLTPPAKIVESILAGFDTRSAGGNAPTDGAIIRVPQVTVRLEHPESDEPSGVIGDVTLRDELGFDGKEEWEQQGDVFRSFEPLRPGRYTVEVRLILPADQQQWTGEHTFIVREGDRPDVTVHCPFLTTTRSLATIAGPHFEPISSDFEIRIGLQVDFTGFRSIEGTEWRLRRVVKPLTVWLDPVTGRIARIDRNSKGDAVEFTPDQPDVDRFMTLIAGDYQVSWQFLLVFKDPQKIAVRLDAPGGDVPRLDLPRQTLAASPGNTQWKLELSEEVRRQVLDRVRLFTGSPADAVDPSAK